MQYLVDGHNLIGQLQDIALDDPHDEAKLTVEIKRFCMRHRVKATVIFDNGITGGVSKTLSSHDVQVIFAPPGVQADNLLMKRARDIGGLKGKFQDMVLVTSDRRIARLAFTYGIDTMASEEFAIMLGLRPVDEEDGPEPEMPKPPMFRFEKDPNPLITPQEIAYWLSIFKRRLHQTQRARHNATSLQPPTQKPDQPSKTD